MWRRAESPTLAIATGPTHWPNARVASPRRAVKKLLSGLVALLGPGAIGGIKTAGWEIT